ncbi:MAG TPA: hypothetical protein VMV48_09370 [Gallionellaceae bacterium]|nr:hypothetical protein [Gallionellaceae bacterium]
MNKFNYISAVILFSAASVAHAQSTATAPALPGDQGIASVSRNLEKNPDNKGLKNASEQLKRNQIKHAEHMEMRAEKHEHHHEAMERPARIERPGK